jgi:hypothetical protein
MCVHMTQSGQTLPQTLCKQELHAPGCPFFQSMLTINYNTLRCVPIPFMVNIGFLFFTYQDLFPRARMILDEGIMYYHQVNNVSLKTIK